MLSAVDSFRFPDLRSGNYPWKHTKFYPFTIDLAEWREFDNSSVEPIFIEYKKCDKNCPFLYC